MLATQIKLGKVFINSLPKSGTHLLLNVMELLGYREHFKDNNYSEHPEITPPIFFNYREVKKALAKINYNPEDTSEKISVGALTPLYVPASILRQWLDVITEGKYILGHIPWTPLLSQIIADLTYHHVFIIREPRAVVASTLAFILDTGSKMPARHFLENDFKQMSTLQRLKFILEGGYAPQAGVEIKSFAEVYRYMIAWQNEPNCLFVRFEDLIGEKGGGSYDKQRDTIKRIASYLGIPCDAQIEAKIKQIYDPSARTFRSGKIDGWKNSLDSESIELLNKYCQPLCQEAGYEI